jgi:hypothetical protein
MKIKLIPTLLMILFSLPSFLIAQLNPSIGVTSLPNDADTICGYPIPVSPEMTFDSYPFFPGDTIPDFTLYDLNGDSINMTERLSNGKPVLIVGLNYTCPYVRNKVAIYNDIFANYSSQVDIIGVYHLEAHPNDDFSPNSGTYGNVSANMAQGIIVDQHNTYLDRKLAAQDLINNEGLNIPVYIDGPCNEWWSNFGPGPSSGYIINPNGTVFVKHGWFDKIVYGHDIYCDIDSLYGVTCAGTTPDGSFTMSLITNDTVYGLMGTTIDAEANLINSTSSDVLIEIDRDQNNLGLGWTTALCADVCLNSSTDQMTFLLPAGATQHFYMHFYSDDLTPGTSNTKVVFRNLNDFSNQYIQDFYAYSSGTVSIEEQESNQESMNLYPNPLSNNELTIQLETQTNADFKISLMSSNGQKLETWDYADLTRLGTDQFKINLSAYSSGMYFIHTEGLKHNLSQRIVKM